MDYCAPHGIPYREFMGIGRGWDQFSRDAVLLWQQLKRETCEQCGTHPDDWNPKAGGHIHAWAATKHSCKGCARVAAGQKALEKELQPGQHVGLKLQVPRRHT